MDILGASSDLNKISWWRNDGGSLVVWSERMIGSGLTLAKSVHAGDIDNDGDIDVVSAAIFDSNVVLWKNESINTYGNINFKKTIIDNNFNGSHRVQLVDIDDDGWLDILGAAYLGNEVAWWKNCGFDENNILKWTKHSIVKGFGNACVAQSIDIDNDGLKDIVATAQSNGTVAWWKQNLNDNLISWSRTNLTTNFTRPWPLYVCDIDNDGDQDVIAASSHQGNNQVKWWENNLINSSGTTHIKHNQQQKDKFYISYLPNTYGTEIIINYQVNELSNIDISDFRIYFAIILKKNAKQIYY